MSYSFSKKSATKADLLTNVKAELSNVKTQQPVHEADIDQATAAAESLVNVMQDDPARDLYCSMSGSIWKSEAGVQSISCNVSVGYSDREAA